MQGQNTLTIAGSDLLTGFVLQVWILQGGKEPGSTYQPNLAIAPR
jgi:hypothetical protein